MINHKILFLILISVLIFKNFPLQGFEDQELKIIYYILKNDINESEKYLERLPPLKKLYYRSLLLIRKEKIKEARKVLEELELLKEGKCPANKLKGILELQWGNPYFAVQYLSDALSCYPEDDTLKLYLCAGLLKNNDFEGFNQMFSSIENFKPKEESLKSLKSLLSSFYKLYKGDLDSSRVEITNIRSPYINEANLMMNMLYDIQKYISFIIADISSIIEYDSNAIFNPEKESIVLKPTEGKDSFRLSMQARLRITPARGRNTLYIEGNILRTQNFSEPANNLNITFLDSKISFIRYFHIFGAGQGIGLSYRAGLTLLDGGRLTKEKSIFAYNEKHEINPAFVVLDYENFRLDVGYIFYFSNFAEIGRNAKGHQPILSIMGYINKKKGFYQSFISFYKENANSEGYDAMGFKVAGSFGYLLPYDFTPYASFFFDYKNHINSMGYFDEKQRIDKILSLYIGVKKSISKEFYLQASYQFLFHPSTIEFYEYNKHIVSFGLSWRKR